MGGQRAIRPPLVSKESAVRAVSKAAAHHQVGRRASDKAQAAQLPSLMGPRLLLLGVPIPPNVLMTTLSVSLPRFRFLELDRRGSALCCVCVYPALLNN